MTKAVGQETAVVVQRCPELSATGWDELLSGLPDTDRIRIEKLHRSVDRQNSATGWHLLHQLGRDWGVTVRRAASGRPCADPPVDASMSHSGRWVAVALCRTGRIGIDVETVRPVTPSLAERCLSPDELAWMKEVEPGAAQNHRFFRLWTAKEAFLKATGVGLSADPRRIRIDCAGEEPVMIGRAAQAWRLSCASPAAGVCVSVCMERAG